MDFRKTKKCTAIRGWRKMLRMGRHTGLQF